MDDKRNLQVVKNAFFMESRELADAMETSLLALERDGSDEESVNEVFRAAHTIKGNSGMFGFERIEKFTHIVESVLDQVRNDVITMDSKMIGLLLESRDFILELLYFYEESKGDSLSEEMSETYLSLSKRLNSYLSEGRGESLGEDRIPDSSGFSNADMKVRNECWHISLRFGRDVFRNGLDPYSFISFLGEKGEIVNIMAVYDDMPDGDDMIPESCYLGFEIDFKGEFDKRGIEDVFEFVSDDCDMRILPPNSNISEYVQLIQELPETSMSIGEMLTEIGTLTESELEEALRLQDELSEVDTGAEEIQPVGEILIEEKMVQQSVLDAALEKQQSIKRREEKERRLIRIDADKLDNMINLIGELVIVGSNVKQISLSEDKRGLTEAVEVMSRLIEDIRDSTMSIRMVQIGETFNKYKRIVRDLSSEKGKNIDLSISGGDTELDKTLIDKISDPLMHLIRNAIDHGIDIPEERKKRGKSGKGTIHLNAYHETGSIVIEVRDDGEGLNRDKVLSKALELGFVKPDQSIPDYELFQYVFEPGFSTAEEVTKISGRGVGMDVAKRNIESLRGTITLESEKGSGTTVKVQLPLTLAIIDGFMVTVGDSFYVLPLDMVVECTEFSKEELDSKDGGNYMNLRGDVLPFVRLREFFAEENEEPEKPKTVVVEYAKKRAGIVVDNLVGEFQTVIKPLGRMFSKLQWISGSTILGTGEVAYILDVPKLVQNVKDFEKRVTEVAENVGR